MRLSRIVHAFGLAAALASSVARAQTPPLRLPDASPRASVSQTIGLTDITISYHRPGVNKRKIWGHLVPHGEVWRAGANENTTITFSSPVTVGGKKLEAGTYGLHVLPTENDWTFILSNESNAWGSFSYDPKEDAARVTVTPKLAGFEERLKFTLDDPANGAVVASLHWEKLAGSFPIDVDTKAVVVASLREQLRGLPRFSWQGWNSAAGWCLRNDTNLDEATTWSDKSLGMNQNFSNLQVKAGLLEKKGDTKTAGELREKAIKTATEVEINNYGYQLLNDGKTDEAIDMFKKNVKDHPASWNAYDSLAEAYARKGDKAQAVANYTKAMDMVKDEVQRKRIQVALAGLK